MSDLKKSFVITLVVHLLLVGVLLAFDDTFLSTKASKTPKQKRALEVTFYQKKAQKVEHKRPKKVAIKNSSKKKEKLVEKQVSKTLKNTRLAKATSKIKKPQSIEKKTASVTRKTQSIEKKPALIKQKPQSIQKQLADANASSTPKAVNVLHEKAYVAQLARYLQEHKSYPKRALRREIEGCVKVKLSVSCEGKLLSFKILKGKKIFHKSIKKLFREAFPMPPKTGRLERSITLVLRFDYRIS